jgi:hypothetical protein
LPSKHRPLVHLPHTPTTTVCGKGRGRCDGRGWTLPRYVTCPACRRVANAMRGMGLEPNRYLYKALGYGVPVATSRKIIERYVNLQEMFERVSRGAVT